MRRSLTAAAVLCIWLLAVPAEAWEDRTYPGDARWSYCTGTDSAVAADCSSSVGFGEDRVWLDLSVSSPGAGLLFATRGRSAHAGVSRTHELPSVDSDRVAVDVTLTLDSFTSDMSPSIAGSLEGATAATNVLHVRLSSGYSDGEWNYLGAAQSAVIDASGATFHLEGTLPEPGAPLFVSYYFSAEAQLLEASGIETSETPSRCIPFSGRCTPTGQSQRAYPVRGFVHLAMTGSLTEVVSAL